MACYLAGEPDEPQSRAHACVGPRDDRFRRDILELLDSSGPLRSRDLPDTCVVLGLDRLDQEPQRHPVLEFLMMRGEIVIAGGVGCERLRDLAERVCPSDVVFPI